MIRRHGTQPLMGQKYTLRHGVYAILPCDEQILLTFQSHPHNEYQLPGGGIDAGEQPLAALYREVLEETGWTISRPRRVGAFRRFVYMPDYDMWAEKLCSIYIAHPVRQIGNPLHNDHTACFVDKRLAAELVYNDGDACFLRHYLTA